MAAAAPAAATSPQVVAIVAAVRDELAPTISRLQLVPDQPWFVGQMACRRLVAAVTGVGRERAVEVVNTLLEEHHPGRIIHVGFAGGLDPSLRAGTVLNVRWVIDGRGAAYSVNNDVPQATRDIPERPQGACLLTADQLVHAVADKQALYARHRATAVDMETFHVARLAHQRGLHLTMLRAISDAATMAIPREAAGWVKPDGSENVGAAILHLLTRPWKIPMTVRLGRNAHLAGENLAKAVEGMLREM